LLINLVENENQGNGYRAGKEHQPELLFHLAREWSQGLIHRPHTGAVTECTLETPARTKPSQLLDFSGSSQKI
jgi:hypothetical protein